MAEFISHVKFSETSVIKKDGKVVAIAADALVLDGPFANQEQRITFQNLETGLDASAEKLRRL